jgi:acyl dehydratase
MTGSNGNALPASGREIPLQQFPKVTAAMLRDYAAASGDSNPIHLDEEAAKGAGLPGIIAHGMVVSAWLAERALRFAAEEGLTGAEDAPGPDFRLREFSSRFRAMVFLGDGISIGGIVRESGASGVVLELQARNQKGEVTTTAFARFSR